MRKSLRTTLLALVIAAPLGAPAETLRCFKNFDRKIKDLENYHVVNNDKPNKAKRSPGSLRLIKKKT